MDSLNNIFKSIITNLVERGIVGGGEHAVGPDRVEEGLLGALHVLNKGGLEVSDLGGIHLVQEATDAAVDDGDLQDDEVRDASSQDDRFTWSSMGMGTYCPCLRSSVSLTPLLRSCWVAASRSEPNWAKAATSRYWASSSFMEPATCFMDLVWAAEPTRDTDRPTLIAGRIPGVGKVR